MTCLSPELPIPDILQPEVEKRIASLQEIDADATTVLQADHRLSQVLAVSPFVGRQLRTLDGLLADMPGLLDAGWQAGAAGQAILAACEAAEEEEALRKTLRQLRNRYITGIAWRDLCGVATLDETLQSLSGLADLLVQATIDWFYRQLGGLHGCPYDAGGEPMPLVVLAMGKLGAGELNFSSDIDLVLAYEKDGRTGGRKPLDHHEFFLRLARKLTKALGDVTEDGFVYRVDLRLRPYGNSGPLVMSMAAMEEYYQTQGREWERYAMIKARAIGPGRVAGEELLGALRPFVYRRYLDYGVIQSLRELKHMINQDVLRQDRQEHLKLGPGGIREIEFTAQVFQLTRGGRDRQLQQRAIQPVLRLLAERGLLSRDESEDLIAAYRYLRQAENHLQAMHDRQEHNLPGREPDRTRLAYSMGYVDYDSFYRELGRHRQRVQASFDAVFGERAGDADQGLFAIWADEPDVGYSTKLLQERGYQAPEEVLEKYHALRHQGVYRLLSRQGKDRFDRLVPELLDLSAEYRNPDEVHRRLLAIVSAIARRESYLALLVEQPSAREQLAKLCSQSSWITEVITRHPALLDELIDPRRLFQPPDRAMINVDLSRLLADLPDDIEAQMEGLRHFKQVQQLRIAAADIMGSMPLMVVSDHLTWLAESLVTVALELAWDYMIGRHGRPGYRHDGQSFQADFAVIGYGKLGGIELGYGSDLDLLFVHDSRGEAQYTDGDRQTENTVFFTRLAQRFVHILTTLTPAGTLYEIDTRLRPNGQSGMLVTSIESLRQYQLNEAWTWEHQALVRARPIAGGRNISEHFETLRRDVLCHSRDLQKLHDDVIEMRQRMREELDNCREGRFDLKQGIGGIVDIEFMVQYLVLRWAPEDREFTRYTDVIRLLEIARDAGKLDGPTCELVTDAYRAFRKTLHRQVLQGSDRCIEDREFQSYREGVRGLWSVLFEQSE